MKNTVSILCFFAILLATVSLAAQGGTKIDDRQIDSLRQVISRTEGEEKIRVYLRLSSHYYPLVKTDSIMQKFLALSEEIDAEAAHQKRYDYQGLVQLNILNAFNNRGEYEETVRRASEYLDFLVKHEVWQFYYQVYQKLCKAYWRAGDVGKSLDEAQKMFEHAQKRQNDEGMAMALIAMSEVYYSQRRFDRQVECLQQSFELLQGNKTFFHIRINICSSLGFSLLELKRYEEALRYAGELENLVREYEAAAKTAVLTARWNLWILRLEICMINDNYDEAEIWCRKLDSINAEISIKINMYSARARIFLSQKQYRQALETANRAMDLFRSYKLTVRDLFLQNIRNTQIEALINLGQADEASRLFKESFVIRDSLNTVEVTARLDEIRTLYEVEKITAENAKISREKERHRNYFIFAFVACLLLAVTLGIWIYYSRQIVVRNRELIRKNQQWAGLIDSYGAENDDAGNEPVPDNVDELIFGDVQKFIESGIYKNHDLTLDILAKKINQNPTYVSNAINRCTGKNFKMYLNEYRIKEAVRILSDEGRTGISIDELASETGFNDRKNFHRVFKKITGLSPTDFRKNI